MCLKPINKTSQKLLAFIQLHLVILFFPNLNYMLPTSLKGRVCSKVYILKIIEQSTDAVEVIQLALFAPVSFLEDHQAYECAYIHQVSLQLEYHQQEHKDMAVGPAYPSAEQQCQLTNWMAIINTVFKVKVLSQRSNKSSKLGPRSSSTMALYFPHGPK